MPTPSEPHRRFAQRMYAFESEGFERILAGVQRRRLAGERVLPLHAGELDFDTPQPIVEAAIAALRRHETRYTPAAGIPALRECIAGHVARTRGIAVSADQVVVTPGAKPLIHFALLALCEPGDEVLCLSPGYPIYRSLVRFVGATPAVVPLGPAGEALDVEAVARRVSPRTRALILNSPHNPTGRMLTPQELEALAELAQRHDLFVIADEIYSRITFERPFHSIASVAGMPARTLIIDGLSKTFAMTGWRLGYGVMPRALAEHFAALMLNTLSCNVAFTQPAAITALEAGSSLVAGMVATLRQRRDAFVAALNRIPGVACPSPDGAFYAFADVRALGLPSMAIAERLLQRYGVAVYPGSAFGAEGEGHLRLSFACSADQLAEAVDHLAAFVADPRPAAPDGLDRPA